MAGVAYGIRGAVKATRFDDDVPWVQQDKLKMKRLFETVEELRPEFKKFKLQWGASRICSQMFTNHRSYYKNKRNPNTYQGARAARRWSVANPEQDWGGLGLDDAAGGGGDIDGGDGSDGEVSGGQTADLDNDTGSPPPPLGE